MVAGRIIAEIGGVWQRLGGGAVLGVVLSGVVRAETARTPGVRAPAMSGGAEHPHIAGARAVQSVASIVSVKHTLVALLARRELSGAGKRSAPGASDRDPIGPRPLAGSVAEGDRARARRAAL